MNLKAYLFEEDRGVSPVIGVILMVAITVILAAVIATFVMNMGPSEEQAPTSSFDFEKLSGGDVDISHDGGESVPKSELDVVVDGSSSDWSDGGDDTVEASDTHTVSSPSSGVTIEVVWNSDEEDKSDVLATYEVP